MVNKMAFKLNEMNSTYNNAINKKTYYLVIVVNQQIIQHVNSAKYLGITLDAEHRWKEQDVYKRQVRYPSHHEIKNVNPFFKFHFN